MKSRLLQAMDYHTIDMGDRIRPFVPDEAALEQELHRLANRHIRWEPGSVAARGDLAVCRLTSGCPRFNRDDVRFAVGSGMFHPELESLVVGMSVGETRELALPEGRVALTLTAVTNRFVPEPDDGMTAALGLEGVSSLAQYREYLLTQQKEEYLSSALYELSRYLEEKLLAGSEFVLYKEDWQAAVERRLQRCRALARDEGMTLEEMTPEQFQGRIPVKSFHELVAMLQSEAWDSLRMHLFGKYYARTDGFTVNETSYETYITEYAHTWHTTREMAREVDPYESYVFNEYVCHASQILRQYIREQIIEARQGGQGGINGNSNCG